MVLWQKAVTFLSRQLKCATNKRSPTHNYRVNLDRVGYSLLCCVVAFWHRPGAHILSWSAGHLRKARDDRFGSIATEPLEARRRVMSASPRKRTNSRSFLYVRFVACVDGSELARLFFTFAGWSVQPCVRPVCAVHMTAGHNALRGSGPGQKPAFEMHWHKWVVLIAGSTGSALRAVGPPNLHITPDVGAIGHAASATGSL